MFTIFFDETFQVVATYLIGMFFVVYFAARHFNEPLKELIQEFPGDIKEVPDPALPSYMTECTRYRLYLGLFVFCTLLCYLFITLALPELVGTWIKGIDKPTVVFSVVIGTLAFINLSTKIPFLKDTIESFRKDLQKRAKIPDKAFEVFQCLQRSEINIHSVEFNNRLQDWLTDPQDIREDIEKNDFSLNKRTLERRWARLSYLIYSLNVWSKEEQFRRHIVKPDLHWLDLRDQYKENIRPKMEKLRKKMRRLEALQHEDNSNTMDEMKKLHQFIENESHELSVIIDNFLIKVYWLITLLLFISNRSAEDPRVHLRKIGWIVDTDKYFVFSRNAVVFVGLAMLMSIIGGATVGSVLVVLMSEYGIAVDEIITSQEIMRWLAFGIPMFVMPTVIVLITKRHLSVHELWPSVHPDQQPDGFSERPLLIYLFVAGLSYLITVVILLGIYLIMSLIVERMQGSMTPIFGFSTLAFITALYIAYLIDTPTSSKPQNKRNYYAKKLPGAISLGLSNVIIIAFFFSLHLNNGSFDYAAMTDDHQRRLLFYIVIGFVIGISMYMTTHTKRNLHERRADSYSREKYTWATLKTGSVSRRTRLLEKTNDHLLFETTPEINLLLSIGDRPGIYFDNGMMITGSVEEINNNNIKLSVSIKDEVNNSNDYFPMATA